MDADKIIESMTGLSALKRKKPENVQKDEQKDEQGTEKQGTDKQGTDNQLPNLDANKIIEGMSGLKIKIPKK